MGLGKIPGLFRAVAAKGIFFKAEYIAKVAARIGEILQNTKLDPHKCYFRVGFRRQGESRRISLACLNGELAEQEVAHRSEAEENIGLLGQALAQIGVKIDKDAFALGEEFATKHPREHTALVLKVRAETTKRWKNILKGRKPKEDLRRQQKRG